MEKHRRTADYERILRSCGKLHITRNNSFWYAFFGVGAQELYYSAGGISRVKVLEKIFRRFRDNLWAFVKTTEELD